VAKQSKLPSLRWIALINIDFFGLARFQSLMAGNLTYPLDFHVRLLAKCEKFQSDFCPPSKS
jgi:hypothetical protein